MFDTLVEACSLMTAFIVNREALDIMALDKQVGKEVISAHKTCSLVKTALSMTSVMVSQQDVATEYMPTHQTII